MKWCGCIKLMYYKSASFAAFSVPLFTFSGNQRMSERCSELLPPVLVDQSTFVMHFILFTSTCELQRRATHKSYSNVMHKAQKKYIKRFSCVIDEWKVKGVRATHVSVLERLKIEHGSAAGLFLLHLWVRSCEAVCARKTEDRLSHARHSCKMANMSARQCSEQLWADMLHWFASCLHKHTKHLCDCLPWFKNRL